MGIRVLPKQDTKEMNDLTKALKFVKGSISTKSFVPAMRHFLIKDGFVMGFNGRIALSSPIACDLTATPEANAFVKAIDTCQEEISLTLLPNGRLAVKSGRFRANIACTQDPYPEVKPEGQFMQCGKLLQAFEALLPFVSEDASRPWSMGVLLRDSSAYATNNVVVAEYWLGNPVPCSLNIPKATVQELVRIGEEPLGIQVCEKSITFYFEGKRFLNSILYTLDWPDIEKILRAPANDGSVPHPVPEGLFDALREVKPFTDKLGRVFLTPQGVSTTPPQSPDDGAHVALPLNNINGCFSLEHLESLEGVAQLIDLSYSTIEKPRPCIWFGEHIRGAVIGMRSDINAR